MQTLIQDFRHGIRVFRRTPGFTAVAVLVLALGIGSNTAVFSLVNSLMFRPRPGRIESAVGVFSRDRTKPDRYRDFSYPTYVDLRARADIFDALLAHTFAIVGIANADGTVSRQVFAAIVSANYFDTLGVRIVAGRPFTPDEERPGANARVAIASYSTWRRSGFDPSFVGSTVRVNGTEYSVVGVAPRGFAGTMTLISPEWWFPLGSYDAVVNEMFKQRTTGLTDRGNVVLNLAGVLRPGLTSDAAGRALDEAGKRLAAQYPESDANQTFLAGP